MRPPDPRSHGQERECATVSAPFGSVLHPLPTRVLARAFTNRSDHVESLGPDCGRNAVRHTRRPRRTCTPRLGRKAATRRTAFGGDDPPLVPKRLPRSSPRSNSSGRRLYTPASRPSVGTSPAPPIRTRNRQPRLRPNRSAATRKQRRRWHARESDPPSSRDPSTPAGRKDTLPRAEPRGQHLCPL